jgi:hypothetical protein
MPDELWSSCLVRVGFSDDASLVRKGDASFYSSLAA